MAWWTTKREGFSILVRTLSTRGSDPVSRDRQDLDASEANKDNPRRKGFFSAVTLSPLSGAKLILRFASCLILPSAILKFFSLRFLASSTKNADLHPTFGRGLDYDINRHSPCQDPLPSVEGPERRCKPGLFLWLVPTSYQSLVPFLILFNLPCRRVQ